MPHPWDTGDLERNWQCYFIPGTSILRNRVAARTLDALRNAENDLVEARVIELREAPDLLGDRSYDLSYLRAIHRQLFQDVYDWARRCADRRHREGRRVLLSTGQHRPADGPCRRGDSPPQTTQGCSEADLARTVAYLYDYANFAHPFREGNGRSTREFFDLLLSERGAGLDWVKTDLAELHSACHAARAESDLGGLIAMFAKILDADPAYDF